MMRRVVFVLSVTLLAIYVCTPTFIYFSLPKKTRSDAKKVADAIPNWLPESMLVKLGLDLQGGVQLVLGVNTDGAIETKLSRIGTEATRWAEEEKLKVKTTFVVKGQKKLRIELDPSTDRDAFREKFKKQYDGLESANAGTNDLEFHFSDSQVQRIKQSSLEQAERVIRTRIDKWGVAEPLISRRADGSVLVQLPGFSDPDKAKELLGRTAQLQLKIVDEQFSAFDPIANTPPEGVTVERSGTQVHFVSEDREKLVSLLSPLVPQDRELLFEHQDIAGGKKTKYRSYVLMAATELSGDDIYDSGVTTDNESLDAGPAVSMRFTGSGGKRFADVTGANVHKRMAIVLDNVVVSAPVINGRIAGGSAIIKLGRGNYQQKYEEASQLALILKSGALPATIEILEERQVGASLGPELAQQGIYSILVGLAAVLLYMFAYYKRPGLIACIALTLNAIFMLAFMASFGFALSLPGIAGFILTLGMAVDSNVLINERIRQELRDGKNARKAISLGFDRVFSTIIDANVTSLIAALVLLETSTSGPIRGFAVTLIIGLCVSIFTALYCTKVFFELALRNINTDAGIRKWCGGERVLKVHVGRFDFMKYRTVASAFGVVFAIATVVVGSTQGLNWAVDFAGGTEIEAYFSKDLEPSKLREVVEKAGVKDSVFQAVGEGTKQYLIRFDNGDAGADAKAHSSKVVDLIKSELKDFEPNIQRVDFVGPQVGKELRTQGFLSVFWALVGIFVYVGLRFDMRFAPGAIAKMAHDAFFVLGFYVFSGRSFDLTSIAALMTVIGYSVNDVIVIYDRIRENIVSNPKRTMLETLNVSLNETLGRSINTSVVTLISLFGILIFGTAQIWNFAVAMSIGVVAATFSSTFVATALVYWFEVWRKTPKPRTTALAKNS